jgi:ubiquinone biosynthesis O-methyltransferase
MNPLRHKFIRQCLDSSDDNHAGKKLRYLDVGCGGGIFAESAARLATTESVTAIDPTPEVIAVARRHQRQDPLLLEPGCLEYKQTAIEHLPVPDSPELGYDVISLFEVIEHIRKPSAFLQTCLPYLKPGGWIIGSTIARTNVSWFTTKFMAEGVLRIVPPGTHDWNQYIQPNELKQWAKVQPELQVTQEGHGWKVMGVVYVPGLGWKEVDGSEEWGNYFFGMKRKDE